MRPIKIFQIPGFISFLIAIIMVSCAQSGTQGKIPEDQRENGSPEPEKADAFMLHQELGQYQSWDLDLGDLDGDGDTDLFVASLGKDDPKLWINDGKGNFTPSDQQIPACSRGSLGDVNGDGRLDLVIAEWDPGKELWTDTLQIWINNGLADFEQDVSLSVVSGTHNFAFGDFDADGDPDLMTVGTGSNSIWFNNGAGEFADSGQEMDAGIDADVALGDLDLDGDLDAITGGWEGLPSTWLNDGQGSLQKVEQTFSDSDLHIHGLSLGDLDGDGDLDVFLVLANRGPHQVWINDGAGRFTIIDTLPGPLGHGVDLGDLDQDGDLDAVTAHGYQSRGEIRIWINDGSAHFSQAEGKFGEEFSAAVAFGDLDLDGDLDIVSALSDWGKDPGPADQIWINDK